MIQLQKDEKILGVFRRHWLTFVMALLPIVILGIIAVISPILFELYFPELAEDSSITAVGVVLALEIVWIVIFLIIADYYLDVWIVTNKRLIFIELHGLFSRTVSSVTLMHIQDVTVEVHGILGTLFKYGEVKIQSAGTEGEFTFRQVPEPYQIKNLIVKTRGEFFQIKNSKQMDILKSGGTTHRP